MSTRVNIHLEPCKGLQEALLLLNNRIVQDAGLDGVRFIDHKPHLTVLMFNVDSSDQNKDRFRECALEASLCCPCQLTGLQSYVDHGFLMINVDFSPSIQQVCKVVWDKCNQMLHPWDAWRVEVDQYEPHITVAVAETDAQLQRADVDLATSYIDVFCKECPADILICDRVDVSVVGAHGTVSGTLL